MHALNIAHVMIDKRIIDSNRGDENRQLCTRQKSIDLSLRESKSFLYLVLMLIPILVYFQNGYFRTVVNDKTVQ